MIILEIAGHLGSDAEERFTATGKRVVSLRVATRVRQGGKDETVWWRVNIWGDRFDRLLPYLKKGTGVIVVGEMSKPETYVDRNGQTQISLSMSAEIVRFSPFGRPGGEQQQQGQGFQSQSSQNHLIDSGRGNEEAVSYGAAAAPAGDGYDGDDLPF